MVQLEKTHNAVVLKSLQREEEEGRTCLPNDSFFFLQSAFVQSLDQGQRLHPPSSLEVAWPSGTVFVMLSTVSSRRQFACVLLCSQPGHHERPPSSPDPPRTLNLAHNKRVAASGNSHICRSHGSRPSRGATMEATLVHVRWFFEQTRTHTTC